MLEQYRISDFVEWNRAKKLKLNPDFQRGSVWSPPARVYLIDTILRGLPIPKIYLRTTTDIETMTSVRDVVDGQQRLRAILDFSDNKFKLTNRAGEFANLTYDTLPEDLKQQFLGYPLAVEQLVNADEDFILEIFSRLNSYTVTLNPAEKRHARYQGKFKWEVREMSSHHSALWTNYGILSTRQRVRKEDDTTMAQFFMIIMAGVDDGGAPKIEKFYEQYDEEFENIELVKARVTETIEILEKLVLPNCKESALSNAPQLIMMFAAMAHIRFGLPIGGLDKEDEMPQRPQKVADDATIGTNLDLLKSAIEAEEPPASLSSFVTRSKSSTQRIASRKIRFETFVRAFSEDMTGNA